MLKMNFKTKRTALWLMQIVISTALVTGAGTQGYAQNRSSKKTATEKNSNKSADTTSKKLTPYQKLFDKKSVKTSSGLITLHIVEGKLYMEMPLSLIGRSFLMSSVVDNVSNMGLAYVGQRSSRPSHICFEKSDSTIQLCLVPMPRIVESEGVGVQNAVKMSSHPTVIGSSPVLAFNKDSSAVVFDATSFFVTGEKHIGSLNTSSFGGFIQKISAFSKGLSFLKDIEAYEDNVAVISNMTYTFKTYFMGMESVGAESLTAELKTTLNLLPSDEFRYRIADYRIGTSVTEYEKIDTREQGFQRSFIANRWRLEPKDPAKLTKGELSEPVKPIVFYVDTLFLPGWSEGVKRGLLKWNDAFEKIGYKNVIQVRDYPSKSEDPKFSSSNISYNCVRYVQIPSRNIGRQMNIDPRSGEILSASILFFKDAPVTLQRERLYQTAAVEPDVRGYELPDHLMSSSIELAMTREMGFVLGLSANLAASSWMPTDSLRSDTFTSREGITSSVMDQIKYNYVAQPGDLEKGVKLTADKLGVYDYYALEWLYKPLNNAQTPADEVKTLRKMISDHASDPRYYYGREQNWSAYFDPRTMIEDLGNDKIKAAKYGINTLRYIAENAAGWVNKDVVDESYRELFVDFIFLKIYDYYRSLSVNLGGMEINRKYEGDPSPTYLPLSKELQKETLQYMLNQADDLKWVDNKELLLMSGMNATISENMSNNLLSLIFQRVSMVAFTQTKSTNPFTLDDMFGELKSFAVQNINRGEEPTKAQTSVLYSLTRLLLHNSSLPKVAEAVAKGKAGLGITDQLLSGTGNYFIETLGSAASALDVTETAASPYEPITDIKYLTGEVISPTFYKHLLELRKDLSKASSKTKSEKTKSMLDYLILSIDKGVAE